MTSADSTNDVAVDEVARLRQEAIDLANLVLLCGANGEDIPDVWRGTLVGALDATDRYPSDASIIASLTQLSALAAWLFLSDHPDYNPEWKLWTGLPLELPEVDLTGRDAEVVRLVEEFDPERWPEEDRLVPAAFADLVNFLLGRLPDGCPLPRALGILLPNALGVLHIALRGFVRIDRLARRGTS